MHVLDSSECYIFWDITSRSPLKVNRRFKRTCSSETSTDFQKATWRYIPEDRTLHDHICTDLKPYISVTVRESLLTVDRRILIPVSYSSGPSSSPSPEAVVQIEILVIFLSMYLLLLSISLPIHVCKFSKTRLPQNSVTSDAVPLNSTTVATIHEIKPRPSPSTSFTIYYSLIILTYH
jgi:hypothetical protein